MTQKVSQFLSFVHNFTIEHELSSRELAQSGYRTNSIGGLDAIDTRTWTYALDILSL